MSYVIATDEVGRGCLAGPVLACAVAYSSIDQLKHDAVQENQKIADSKLLSASVREQSKQWLYEQLDAYYCAVIAVEVIDDINILQASLLAMRVAIEQVIVQQAGELPSCIYVDGNSNPYASRNITRDYEPENALLSNAQADSLVCLQIGGDRINTLIAAASICAKQERDKLMLALHEQFPVYHWHKNKGYPTKQHLAAIRENNITKWHRVSFKPISNQALFD